MDKSEALIERLERSIERLETALLGETGLFVRVDRLERGQDTQRWWLRALGVAVASALAKLIGEHFWKI